MFSTPKKWLFPILAIFIGITLLYLALRGVDFSRLLQDLSDGNYLWAVPFVVGTLAAHLVRAWRWRILLESLPENKGGSKIPLRTAFASVMIGFMANYAAPRLGEVVRTSHMALRQRFRFSSVLGTVFADRFLDMAVLGIFLFTLPLVLGDGLASLFALLEDALGSLSGNVILLLAAALVVFVIGGLWLLTRTPKSDNSDASVVAKAVSAFKDGIAALTSSDRKFAIALSTIVMWGFYLLMTYVPLLIFGLGGAGGLSLVDAWALLLIGALGIVVPSPGGVGSYHFLAIQSLVVLWGISHEAAASYAIFTHAAQLVLYTVVGFLFLLFESATWTQLRSVPESGGANET